jgi:hypothetical protein
VSYCFYDERAIERGRGGVARLLQCQCNCSRVSRAEQKTYGATDCSCRSIDRYCAVVERAMVVDMGTISLMLLRCRVYSRAYEGAYR